MHKKVRVPGDGVREVREKGGSPGRSHRPWDGTVIFTVGGQERVEDFELRGDAL